MCGINITTTCEQENHPSTMKFYRLPILEGDTDATRRDHDEEKRALRGLNCKVRGLKCNVQKKEDKNEHCAGPVSTISSCYHEAYAKRSSSCKKLAQIYDDYKIYSQLSNLTKLMNELNDLMHTYSNDKECIAILNDQKNRTERLLKEEKNGLFLQLKNSGIKYIPGTHPSYFDSLSEKDQQNLINTVYATVINNENICSFAESMKEFEAILNVFREKL